MKLSQSEWTCIDDEVGVWARSYAFNDSGATSNCFVVRIAEDELAIISPPCHLSAADFEALEQHGRVTAMVAPNGFHNVGLPEFHRRYPAAVFHASAKAAARIAKRCPELVAAQPLEALQSRLPDHVKIFDGEQLSTPDLFARVESPRGTIWYSNDVLVNLAELPSAFVLRWLFKLTRSAPGFRVNRLVLKFLRPKAGFAAWLREQFEAHPPAIVVPGHGMPITGPEVAAQTRAVLEAGL